MMMGQACVVCTAHSTGQDSELRLLKTQVLSRLAEKMKRDVDVGLIADFRRFHREKAAASGARPTLDATAPARDEASES